MKDETSDREGKGRVNALVIASAVAALAAILIICAFYETSSSTTRSGSIQSNSPSNTLVNNQSQGASGNYVPTNVLPSGGRNSSGAGGFGGNAPPSRNSTRGAMNGTVGGPGPGGLVTNGMPAGGTNGMQGSGTGDSAPSGSSGGSSSSYALSGTYSQSGGAISESGKTYVSSNTDVSAVYVSDNGVLTLTDAILVTTGNTTSSDASSFYGLNAGLLVASGSKVTFSGGSIATSGSGANGAFATGAGSLIEMSNSRINATGEGAHGVDATLAGNIILTNMTIFTAGGSGAALATDRGGGTVMLNRGRIFTRGAGSPGIYSTGLIEVSDTNIVSIGAEAAVIEGANYVNLTNTTLSGYERNGVMIYQSMSGDAQGNVGHFTMSGGSLSAYAGALFYVTNTKATITLSHARLNVSSGVLVNASAGRWGTSGSNGGTVLLTAVSETLNGNIVCDSYSSINATLQSNTVLDGAVDGAALTLDSTSRWNVTGNSVLTSLADPDGLSAGRITNIYGNGHNVTYSSSLSANKWLGGKTYSLTDGGYLVPAS